MFWNLLEQVRFAKSETKPDIHHQKRGIRVASRVAEGLKNDLKLRIFVN